MDAAEIRKNYERDGYVVVQNALTRNELAPTINAINAHVDAHARALQAQGKVSNLHASEPFERRLAALYDGLDLNARMMDDAMPRPVLDELVRRDGIVDGVAALVGQRVSFTGDFHLRPKLPGSERTSFPLHQDSQYYGKPTRTAHIVTAWLPLIDVNATNGCLWLMPGSHRWGFFDSARDANENMRTFEDIEKRGPCVPVPMNAGDVLLFSNLTFHGSKVNDSRNVRWSLDLRYCPTPSDDMPAPEREGLEAMLKKLDTFGRKMSVVRGEGVGV